MRSGRWSGRRARSATRRSSRTASGAPSAAIFVSRTTCLRRGSPGAHSRRSPSRRRLHLGPAPVAERVREALLREHVAVVLEEHGFVALADRPPQLRTEERQRRQVEEIALGAQLAHERDAFGRLGVVPEDETPVARHADVRLDPVRPSSSAFRKEAIVFSGAWRAAPRCAITHTGAGGRPARAGRRNSPASDPRIRRGQEALPRYVIPCGASLAASGSLRRARGPPSRARRRRLQLPRGGRPPPSRPTAPRRGP